jgi:hypothetical protein
MLRTQGLLPRLSMFIFLFPATGMVQAQSRPDGAGQGAANIQGTDSATAVHLLYTGKFMGHARIPDLQGPDKTGWSCDENHASESVAVRDFRTALQDPRLSAYLEGSILVGTGDNFAPELEARKLCKSGGGKEITGSLSKEDYTWDEEKKQWCRNEDVGKQKSQCSPDLDELIEEGNGTIPADNVAQFFIHEGYAALVPGRHDFYFGAEHLRQLARYLASTPISENKKRHLDAVQMLGSNLIIETNWKETDWKSKRKPLPDTEAGPKFAPRFPKVEDLLSGVHGNFADLDANALLTTELKFTGLADGDSVYPWFMGVTVEVTGADPNGEIISALKTVRAYICPTVVRGDPNALALPPTEGCTQLVSPPEPTGDGTKIQFQLAKADSGDKHSLLKSGNNYGLCMAPASTDSRAQKEKRYYCVRFSVYTPLFQSKWGRTTGNAKAGIAFKEPSPYVLLDGGSGPAIAIFGVVDPQLTEYVGLLNTTWENTEEKFKTTNSKGRSATVNTKKLFITGVKVKDPAESLRQLLEYFDAQHPEFKEENDERKAGSPATKPKLLRVLLAQMSPQQAQILAIRLGKFDVVVTEANPDLAAVNDKIESTISSSDDKRGAYPVFVAVPEPYYVPDRSGKGKSKWMADIGSLTIEQKDARSVGIVSEHIETAVSATSRQMVTPPRRFWISVADYLNQHCLTKLPRSQPSYAVPVATGSAQEQQIAWLTACLIQKELGADVVLLQKRDFFPDLPFATNERMDTVQDYLDRIIWKGDFLTLLYVPGSTLQAVLKQSKTFDTEDTSKLSLASEKKRGLLVTGLRHDPDTDTDLINEVALDTSRVYAVATTDFIGVGDTGYPDLTNSALRKLSSPLDFDRKQLLISAVVCKKLTAFINGDDSSCRPPEDLHALVDDTKASPSNVSSVYTFRNSLWKWSLFDIAKEVPGTPKEKEYAWPSDRAEWAVEQRPWGAVRINPPDTTLFALNEAALNVNVLDHKFSDAVLAQKFFGNPVPQLSAKRSHVVGFDLQPQILYSRHRWQLFEKTEERYNVQYTGQNNAPRVVNQKENLFTSDSGAAFDLWNRQQPHFEIVTSFHYETQLIHPTISTLAPLPTGTTLVPPVDTSRTHYLLPRLGVRYADRISWIEAGFEDGGQLNAVRLFPVSATTSQFLLQRTNIPVSGIYWKWHVVVPFSPKVSWTVDDDGDFFFNQHADATTDTRFRSDAKTSVNFQVFRSLAFAPTYEFFYYANKVQETWFWQGQASLQMKFQFDFWNRRHKLDQLKFKPPQPGSM